MNNRSEEINESLIANEEMTKEFQEKLLSQPCVSDGALIPNHMTQCDEEERAYSFFIVGLGGEGKSYTLKPLAEDKHNEAIYVQSETKPAGFRHRMHKYGLSSDPRSVFPKINAFSKDKNPRRIIVLDSLTATVDAYQRDIIPYEPNGEGWSNLKNSFTGCVNTMNPRKLYLFIGHLSEVPKSDPLKYQVKTPGLSKEGGVERYFGNILIARRMLVEELTGLESEGFLEITDEERNTGIKFVLQVKPNSSNNAATARTQDGLFPNDVFFIDNDIRVITRAVNAFNSFFD